MIQIYYLPAVSLPWKLCAGRGALATELSDGRGPECNAGSPVKGWSAAQEGEVGRGGASSESWRARHLCPEITAPAATAI